MVAWKKMIFFKEGGTSFGKGGEWMMECYAETKMIVLGWMKI